MTCHKQWLCLAISGVVAAVLALPGTAGADAHVVTTTGSLHMAWQQVDSMTQPRSYHNAVRLADGRVLVAGGCPAFKPPVASAEIYSPRSGTWSSTGPMLLPRCGASAVRLDDGQILVAGGQDEIRVINRPDHVHQTQLVGLEFVGVGVHHNLAVTAAEGLRHRRTRYAGNLVSNLKLGEVTQ